MKNASVKKFVALRDALLKEQAALVARLAEIEQALGDSDVKVAAPKKATAPAPAPAKAKAPVKRRARNAMSLKEAVLKVTSSKALTKAEILTAVEKIGYKFSTKDPGNSLNTVLYSGKTFKNNDGKFSPAK